MRRNNEFYTNVEKQLDRLKYNLRWKDKINDDMVDDKIVIPFSKNSVSLPPNMNTEKENYLQFFRNKALEIIKKESRFLKNNERFKKDNAMI